MTEPHVLEGDRPAEPSLPVATPAAPPESTPTQPTDSPTPAMEPAEPTPAPQAAMPETAFPEAAAPEAAASEGAGVGPAEAPPGNAEPGTPRAPTKRTTSQIPTAVVENATVWRRAYMKEFETRRTAIMKAVAAQRTAALGELDRVLSTSGGPARSLAPVPTRDTVLGPKLGATTTAVAEQIQRTIEALIVQRIVDSLKEIVAAEVRRQLAAGPSAGSPDAVETTQEAVAPPASDAA